MALQLLRRRSVPVPTAFGLLVLLLAFALVLALAVWRLPRFLEASAPGGRGLLVVEGWMSREGMRFAAERFRAGGYELMVVAGGPLDGPECGGVGPTYADRAAAEMRRLGIVEPSLAVVPAPASAQDRTYRSAVSVRQWLERTGRRVESLDVLSQGPHTRRSRALYQLALGDGIRVGSIAAPTDYPLEGWWRHSTGAKEVLTEAIGYTWAVCCFRPGPRGSIEEQWGVPATGSP